MKTKIFTLCLVALLVSTVSFAKIRRVGYPGTALAGTDYSNLQLAHDSASARDTIMLYPGTWSANISKKLIFIGPGYFITGTGANAGLQNLTGTLNVNFYLYSGADSSVYEGINNLVLYPDYDEVVNNVIIRRCRGDIYFNNKTLSNWQVSQSFLNSLSHNWSGVVKNLTVSNSFISSIYLSGGVTQTGQLNNNVIYNSDFGGGSFISKNNILIEAHSSDNNVVYQNSIGTDWYPLPTGNNNKNVLYDSMYNHVFVGLGTQGSHSNDGRYALKANSPAIGAGEGGTNCGMFGGANPYVLSGMPKIPAFYKLTAPSNTTSTNPYTITFSVRSNN